ncbi:hypothetical protein BRARA_A02016 [Brassica rapa]|uniref:Uncharacterized protein n=1 Tax=Brassica campestris TaxID=3711 RepID=A0A398ANI8_BRACM|nr:hypothetical protein BRARA_A02016 [Brassica rapa]
MEVKGQVMCVLLMCYIFGHIITSHNCGFIEARISSKFGDLEIEKKLRTINKPAVKIIKSEFQDAGHIIFYGGSGLNH